MAISMMVSKEDYEKNPENVTVVTDFPGAAGTLYMRETHKGLVLFTGEHNYYDDSDFFALVWDDAKGEPVEVGYASTRGWTYPNNATVDATPEIVEKYLAWKETMRQAYLKMQAEKEAKTVAKYKEVKVVRGRKVPLGTLGRVFWMGNSGFGMSVGLELANGSRVFTALKNVEVAL